MIAYCFFATPADDSLSITSDIAVRVTRLGKKYLRSEKIVNVEVKDLDFHSIAQQFADFSKLVGHTARNLTFGIEFELTFPSADDVHGMHFPSEFICFIAEMRSSLSVAISVGGSGIA